MAKKTYTVARQFTDKSGRPCQVGTKIEMDEKEAQPKVDSGELTADEAEAQT